MNRSVERIQVKLGREHPVGDVICGAVGGRVALSERAVRLMCSYRVPWNWGARA